jgi:hypothetical protein
LLRVGCIGCHCGFCLVTHPRSLSLIRSDDAYYRLPPDGISHSDMCVGLQGCGEVPDSYFVFSSGKQSTLAASSRETELVCAISSASCLVWAAQPLDFVDLIGSAAKMVSDLHPKVAALGLFRYLLPTLIGKRWRFRTLADRVCLILGRIYGFSAVFDRVVS